MSENTIEPQEYAELKLDKERYTLTPSGKAVVKLLLNNHGPEDDVFKLSVQGVPPAWITVTETVISLAQGEEKEITFPRVPIPCQSLLN
jgi:uncharacterized membrane protein